MNTPLKTTLLLCFLAIVVGGAWLFLREGETGGLDHSLTKVEAPLREEPTDAVLRVDPASVHNLGTRTELRRVADVVDRAGRTYEQGYRGRVVDPAGYPVVDCDVYLMPSSSGINVLQMMQQKGQGRRFLPVAHDKTDRRGKFQLGVAKVQPGHQYDLWVLHPSYCELRVNRLALVEKDKFDHGDLRLRKGVAVRGRITVQGRGLPVAKAIVTITGANGQVDVAPPPGRENGCSVSVDVHGNYQFDNVDPDGHYKMTASAVGFAAVEKGELTFVAGRQHRLDFELPTGHRIAGVVTDAQGKPILAAKVSAYALSQKTAQTLEARSDAQGRFDLAGLHQGAFTVTAQADGYIEAKAQPISVGKTDLHLMMESQGRVDVQVFGKSGQPLSNYHLVLKTHVAGQNGGEAFFGRTNIDKKVRGARDGKSFLSGINPMDYVVEVHAKGHAKAFSSPFKIVSGGRESPTVTVKMNEGGVVAGVVQDMQGKPIAGAEIATLPKGHVRNILVDIFNPPTRITKTTVKSNAQGQFRISLLNDGDYQLQIRHSEYCTSKLDGCTVVTGNVINLKPIRMARGVLISGIARVDGLPKGQVKVTVAGSGGLEGSLPVSCDAVSDNNGRFTLSRRLPPGTYEARAGEQTQDNHFGAIFQMHQSKQTFTILRGQHKHTLQMNVERLKEDH